jgi:toxin CptA
MLDQRIAIAPSMMLAIALGAVHLAAAALLWIVPVPDLGKAVFTLAICISLVYFLARDALLHAPHAIVALDVRDDGTVSLQTRSGEWIECDVLDSSYVAPRLTVVNFRPRGGQGARHLVLVPDNVDPRDYRRLRMWLRWKRGDGGGPAAASEKN